MGAPEKVNLNEHEAAAQYGMSVHWYRRARWQGNGPKFIKLVGAVLYPRAELEKFFNAHVVSNTGEPSKATHPDHVPSNTSEPS